MAYMDTVEQIAGVFEVRSLVVRIVEAPRICFTRTTTTSTAWATLLKILTKAAAVTRGRVLTMARLIDKTEPKVRLGAYKVSV